MHGVLQFAETHPFWDWMASAAILLLLEVGSASGYLLWPAGSAAVVALLTLVTPLGEVGQPIVFALLTIVSTYVGRRYLRPAAAEPGPDINDKTQRLVGRTGQVTHGFEAGGGRVFVDGAEWGAEIDLAEARPAKGEPVQVVEVLGGGRVRVRSPA